MHKRNKKRNAYDTITIIISLLFQLPTLTGHNIHITARARNS